jgi:STE24 endopeptidase
VVRYTSAMSSPYTLVALFAIVCAFLVSTAVSFLNQRMLGEVPPAELADVYEPERYADAQRYARARARFGLLSRTFDLFLLLGFWACSGFEALVRAVRSLGWPIIPTALAYVFTLVAVSSIASLPFDLYSTFVLEQRFGFNRTTWRTYIADQLKGIALGVAIGAPALSAVVWLFERTGQLAFLYAWIFGSVAMLLLSFVAPAWIMPLFMRFTPLPEGELRTRILDYARSVDFPLENLFVVDGSRRSTRANAFFTGIGRHRRIGLFDTLIERCTPDELTAIVAHEVGHYKKRHVTNGMWLGFAQLGVTLFIFGVLMRYAPLYAAFGVSEPSAYVGLVLCALVYEPVTLVTSLFALARSRRNEYEADRFAVETTGLGAAMISGLKQLARDSLSNLTPHPSYVWVHYSHPPLRERVLAIAREQETIGTNVSRMALASSLGGSMP